MFCRNIHLSPIPDSVSRVLSGSLFLSVCCAVAEGCAKALEAGGTELMRTKLMVVGPGRAGKTALINGVREDEAVDEDHGVMSTVGVAGAMCQVKGVRGGPHGSWAPVSSPPSPTHTQTQRET